MVGKVSRVEDIGDGVFAVTFSHLETGEPIAQIHGQPKHYPEGALFELSITRLSAGGELTPATGSGAPGSGEPKASGPEPGQPVAAIVCDECKVVHFQGSPLFDEHREAAVGGVRLLPWSPSE